MGGRKTGVPHTHERGQVELHAVHQIVEVGAELQVLALTEEVYVLADSEIPVVLAGRPKGIAAETADDARSRIPRPLFGRGLRCSWPECCKRQRFLPELQARRRVDASVVDRAAENVGIEQEGAVAAKAVAIQIVAKKNRKRVSSGERGVARNLPTAKSAPDHGRKAAERVRSLLPFEQRQFVDITDHQALRLSYATQAA